MIIMMMKMMMVTIRKGFKSSVDFIYAAGDVIGPPVVLIKCII